MEYYIYLIFGYGMGSLPFGLVLCYIFGYGDIRKIGSGNIGATNVLRTGNKVLALVTVLLDVGKGALVVVIVHAITSNTSVAATAGVFAIIGHNYPIWLKFKGGKGVATTLGTYIAINPIVGGLSVLMWGITATIFRFSSLAGIVSIVSLPIFAYMTENNVSTIYIIIVAMGVGRHIPNIKRLLKGTEPKISFKRP